MPGSSPPGASPAMRAMYYDIKGGSSYEGQVSKLRRQAQHCGRVYCRGHGHRQHGTLRSALTASQVPYMGIAPRQPHLYAQSSSEAQYPLLAPVSWCPRTRKSTRAAAGFGLVAELRLELSTACLPTPGGSPIHLLRSFLRPPSHHVLLLLLAWWVCGTWTQTRVALRLRPDAGTAGARSQPCCRRGLQPPQSQSPYQHRLA